MKTRQTNNKLNKTNEKGENARDKYQVRALLSFPSTTRVACQRERERETERGGGRGKVGYLAALSINN